MSEIEHQYFFRLATSKSLAPEISVVSSDDPEEVWFQGAMTICHRLQDYLSQADGELDWELEVSDESGNVRYRYTFIAEKF
jgi:hypothetical protein